MSLRRSDLDDPSPPDTCSSMDLRSRWPGILGSLVGAVVGATSIAICHMTDAPPSTSPDRATSQIAADGSAEYKTGRALPAAPAANTIDTARWTPVRLSKLGEVPFAFDGLIKVPPGTRTRTGRLHDSNDSPMGVIAFLDLPDGLRVLLTQRTSMSLKDPLLLKELLGSTGRIVVERRGPTWFMIGVQHEYGIAVQGSTWGVEPGLDCSTERPLTPPEIELVIALCTSLASG